MLVYASLWKYLSMQICKQARMQDYKYASLCMYGIMELFKYSSMLECKFASMQVCKYTYICMYASIKV